MNVFSKCILNSCHHITVDAHRTWTVVGILSHQSAVNFDHPSLHTIRRMRRLAGSQRGRVLFSPSFVPYGRLHINKITEYYVVVLLRKKKYIITKHYNKKCHRKLKLAKRIQSKIHG